ncbi:unnamed protein product [Rangifer tarandus platyrhynchus]|uniref:Uncharacterized protein n=2 Tax=Rangifer tarandus platyrhynchus TaxID=3082113 RepID=A0ABN8ZPY0_RANTA|nr:unnamed protein product [Rangifer tarandus platyrhynchus]
MGAGSVPTRMCSRDLGGVGAVPGSRPSVWGLPLSCGSGPGDWAGPGQALGWGLHSLPALSRQTEALLTVCRCFDLCGRGGQSNPGTPHPAHLGTAERPPLGRGQAGVCVAETDQRPEGIPPRGSSPAEEEKGQLPQAQAPPQALLQGQSSSPSCGPKGLAG